MEPIDRRSFIATTAAGVVTASAADIDASPEASAASASRDPVFLATWDFGQPAVDRAAHVLAAGGSLLDAVEKGINVPENDPKVDSVGYGGLPNARGDVELDAAIMDGTRHRVGAVLNLHKIKNPISVARLVLERTLHSTLAGEGAFLFALEMGFSPTQLLTPQALEAWLKWKNDPNRKTFWIDKHHHDTIGLVAVDGKGHIVSGCSTSGLAWKLPGRVADSALVGSGVYADDAAGAASATGNGDIMQNYCTSFYIVTLMALGRSPQAACEECLRHMVRTSPSTRTAAEAAVIAINPKGEIGAASMNRGFALDYAVWRDGKSSMHRATIVYP
jgi:N4-(beta-N-acetylglucosaminyl)-L-asparaginase